MPRDIVYRADLDGLRGLSVLAVLLYHLGVDGFGGGYIGVDVFFVISGFLITQLICARVDKGDFSFVDFYIRRLRRLFPALFTVLLASFTAALVLLSPQHLQRLGQSHIWALLAGSNIFFWNESGYFDAEAHLKPLLHTWSLSVEWQFYLVWPPLLVGLLRWSRHARHRWLHEARLLPALLLTIFVAGLLLTEMCLPSDPEAAFYLAPFRCQEFALGALMVWFARRRPRHDFLQEIAVFVGLGAILYPAMIYSRETAFPGVAAVLPCLGACAVVYGGTARHAGRLLNNRLCVSLGLISYSLYLIHWPILVFGRYWLLREFETTEKIAAVVLSLVLAVAVYSWIEKPFRRRSERSWRPGAFALCCALLSGIQVGICLITIHYGGFPERLEDGAATATANVAGKKKQTIRYALSNRRFPASDTRNVLVVGDSHARDLFNALHLAGRAGRDPDLRVAWVAFDDPCISILRNWAPTGGRWARKPRRVEYCRGQYTDLVEHLSEQEIQQVFVSASWTTNTVPKIGDLVGLIREHSDAQVFLANRRIRFRHQLPDLYARFQQPDGFPQYVTGYLVVEEQMNAQIDAITRDMGVGLIDVAALVLNEEGLPETFAADGSLLYFDGHHWTLAGAELFGGRILADLEIRLGR